MRSLLWVSVLSAALTGCIADAGVGVRTTYVEPPPPPPPQATVTVTAGGPPPTQVYEQPAPVVEEAYVEPAAMVYVQPDVQVIEDYDYPVFYSNNLYWRYEGGIWYSSSWHDRGWGEAREVPVTIRRIDRPTAYVHYHADVHATVGQPGYRNPHPTVVVHPTQPPPYRVEPGRPQPTVTVHGPQPQPQPTVTVHGPQPQPQPTVTVHGPAPQPTVTEHGPAPTSHPTPAPYTKKSEPAPKKKK